MAETQEVKKPARGIVCPQCGSRRFSVVYTLPKDGYIVRNRECQDCGKRVITQESRL